MYPEQLITRIAPTPSGYLHMGNAFNFLLIWLHARMAKGKVLLRIDDIDAPRLRKEYLDDIFQLLDKLNIDINGGPSSSEEHLKMYSSVLRMERYHSAIEQLKTSDKLFACECSRKEILQTSPKGYYTGTCLNKHLPLEKEGTSLRWITSLSDKVSYHEWSDLKMHFIPESMQYAIIRRKDHLPAYQLTSVCDDVDMNINFIVRGFDLLPSTIFQSHLAEHLGYAPFHNISFYHHPLLKDEEGNKLSKSLGSMAVKHFSSEQILAQFCQWLGWTEKARHSGELLKMAQEGLPVIV
jgi:glutamyl/glutaminyl-tRNA synthetase